MGGTSSSNRGDVKSILSKNRPRTTYEVHCLSMMHAAIEVPSSFRLNSFLNESMMGFLNPNSSEISPLFCLVLVVHLGHGSFHPVGSFIFLQARFSDPR